MSLRTSEARRAEVASTRSKAQCAATEHRASEAQSGAKTRSDHAELRGGRIASGSVARRLLRIVGTEENCKRACEQRRPEGLEWRAHEVKRSAQSKAAKRLEARGHAQRASAAPEHRAAVREAKGRLGPGNLEGEARKYAGPYPRAAKGEGAGETGGTVRKWRTPQKPFSLPAPDSALLPGPFAVPRAILLEPRAARRRFPA